MDISTQVKRLKWKPTKALRRDPYRALVNGHTVGMKIHAIDVPMDARTFSHHYNPQNALCGTYVAVSPTPYTENTAKLPNACKRCAMRALTLYHTITDDEPIDA
jgi:hypothetical protein